VSFFWVVLVVYVAGWAMGVIVIVCDGMGCDG